MLPFSFYVTRTGISPLRKEENAVPMKEERRIPAGINWAKTTMTPPVKKSKFPIVRFP
jgi:hypothetical protein